MSKLVGDVLNNGAQKRDVKGICLVPCDFCLTVYELYRVFKLRRCRSELAVISPASFNPLKPELNPICYLLALLGAHHFLHVSTIRVKLLTFRLLMSYIYIYIWSTHS